MNFAVLLNRDRRMTTYVDVRLTRHFGVRALALTGRP